MFVILTLIVFVAAFAIISHLILMVAEKRQEIGVLKALGRLRAAASRCVFMAEGMLIGAGGHRWRAPRSGLTHRSGPGHATTSSRSPATSTSSSYLPMKLHPPRADPDRRRRPWSSPSWRPSIPSRQARAARPGRRAPL